MTERTFVDNPAVYAMKILQKELTAEVKHAGLTSEDDVISLVKEIRDSTLIKVNVNFT